MISVRVPDSFLSLCDELESWKIRLESNSSADSLSAPGPDVSTTAARFDLPPPTHVTVEDPKLLILLSVALYLKETRQTRVIGVVTKPSRSRDLAARGLLSALPRPPSLAPPSPTQFPNSPPNAVAFLPIDWPYTAPSSASPLTELLLSNLSGLLLKATDFIQVEPARPLDRLHPILDTKFSASLTALLAALPAAAPAFPLIEPLDCLSSVIDRQAMMQTLQIAASLDAANHRSPTSCPSDSDSANVLTWRPPRCTFCDDLDPAALAAAAAAAGLMFPLLVKARVGCGPPESHHMAWVLEARGLAAVRGYVPGPVVLQEFKEHGGQQLKVYVIQDAVFWADKRSLPDLGPLLRMHEASPISAVTFSSLLDMPTNHDDLRSRLGLERPAAPDHCTAAGGGTALQVGDAPSATPTACARGVACAAVAVSSVVPADRVRACAAAIRRASGLSIFGFDIIVPAESESDAGPEFLVVDLNAFPSFKGFDPEQAAAAIARCFEGIATTSPG